MNLRVGITRDDRFLEHKTGHSHPEHPVRLAEIHRMLDRDFADRLTVITPKPATVEQVEMVHTPAHIRRVLKTADQNITSLSPDTPVSAKSYLAAWLAVGGCLQGIDLLMENRCDAFFALVRPPGHHATADRAAGFCIFNNLAVAARYAASRFGIERILVVDWDIHHGNGIHDIFYDSRGVYYYSTHDPMLYPYSGALEETGEGPGEGFTMNIPLLREMTDDDMVYLYHHTLLPVITGYRPQLIMVAAGFDAHADDPIGRCRFSELLYGRITRMLIDARAASGTPEPPLFFTLEGGYAPRALTRSVHSVLSALTGDPILEMPPENALPAVSDCIEAVRNIHHPYGFLK